VRVFVANLRKKLEPQPNRPRYLHTEPGMGYRFTP
jgi:two-component system KDP operon response regulator KdpE